MLRNQFAHKTYVTLDDDDVRTSSRQLAMDARPQCVLPLLKGIFDLEIMKKRDERCYFKSAKGTPVDWVFDNVPYEIVASTKSIGWQEKADAGAVKKLGPKFGSILGPRPRIPFQQIQVQAGV